MKFVDISQNKESLYRLQENEKVIFYMLNRSGAITFELAGRGAEAHIFAFHIGKNSGIGTLALTQKHSAPETVSHTLIKSVLSNTAQFAYDGLVHITKHAVKSDASQESRVLLLSPDAQATAKPTLEILADDVRCRHAATTSSLNIEQLFFAQSRGLSKTQAEKLLIDGFFNEALEKMEGLGANTIHIKNTLSAPLC